MEAKRFADSDKQWGDRYLLVLALQDGIDREILVSRQNELVDSIEAAGVPADELFGDPSVLAQADAAEFGSAEVVAESEDGFGLRDILTVTGLLMLIQGVIAGVVVLVSRDGAVDVTVGPTVLFMAIAATMLGALVAMGEFSAGRARRAVLAAAAAAGVFVGGVVLAAWEGDRAVLVAAAPAWGIALACLVPGLLVFGAGRLVPAREPRDEWTDDEWFDRLRDGLRAKGVTGEVIAEHERTLRAGVTTGAQDDYGRPGAMVERLAAADPAAPVRRWRLKAGAAAVFAVGIALAAVASFVDEGLSWGSLSFLAILVLLAPTALKVWRERPAKVGA